MKSSKGFSLDRLHGRFAYYWKIAFHALALLIVKRNWSFLGKLVIHLPVVSTYYSELVKLSIVNRAAAVCWHLAGAYARVF